MQLPLMELNCRNAGSRVCQRPQSCPACLHLTSLMPDLGCWIHVHVACQTCCIPHRRTVYVHEELRLCSAAAEAGQLRVLQWACWQGYSFAVAVRVALLHGSGSRAGGCVCAAVGLPAKVAAAMQASLGQQQGRQQTDPRSYQQFRTDLDLVKVPALFAITCTHKQALPSAVYSPCQLTVSQRAAGQF